MLILDTTWCTGRNREGTDKAAFKKLGTCCMAHTTCADVVPPEKEKYVVQSTMGYTMRDCKCEDSFINCTTDIPSVSWLSREISYNRFVLMCIVH